MATQKIARDAGTGRIVTPQYAASHPKTTVVETIKRPAPRAPSKPGKK